MQLTITGYTSWIVACVRREQYRLATLLLLMLLLPF